MFLSNTYPARHITLATPLQAVTVSRATEDDDMLHVFTRYNIPSRRSTGLFEQPPSLLLPPLGVVTERTSLELTCLLYTSITFSF